jgi:hypothetical protein
LADRYELGPQRTQGLVDILDRILDKGLVVAGDIRVRLADVELLTIQIRLLVCSIDKADEIGLRWWRGDPYYSGETALQSPQMDEISSKLDRLEARLKALEPEREAK